MAYFNVTDAPEDAVDGVDVARNKSVDMVSWQNELAKSLQKADANASSANASSSITPASSADHQGHTASVAQDQDNTTETAAIQIPQDSGTKTASKTFSPQAALVKAGETITWTNSDSVPHTIDSRDGSISSGYVTKGQGFQHTFNEAGTYEYYCTLHPWMTGSIKVEAAS